MRKIYSFGKIAYNGKRKINEVTLEIELREKENIQSIVENSDAYALFYWEVTV